MKFNIRNSIYFCLFIYILTSSCSHRIHSELKQETNFSQTTITEAQDSLIYLGFQIFQNKNSKSNFIELDATIISAAYLKQDISSTPTIPKNKIRCSLLNENKEIIKSTVVDNPLLENTEYVEGHSCGHDHSQNQNHNQCTHEEKATIKRKLIKKEIGYFGFRARYDSSVRYVQIELADPNGNPMAAEIFVIENE